VPDQQDNITTVHWMCTIRKGPVCGFLSKVTFDQASAHQGVGITAPGGWLPNWQVIAVQVLQLDNVIVVVADLDNIVLILVGEVAWQQRWRLHVHIHVMLSRVS
jgi:hypothetical protein